MENEIEVINAGDELLLGHVINAHLGFIAEAVFPLGLRVERQVCVPDGEAIRDAILEASRRTRCIIVTGGLGPTADDVSRETAAELAGAELILDEKVLDAVARRLQNAGLKLTDDAKRQALRPKRR